ncbi:peptide deformylase [Phyllobacterium sp. BT25]|uniref:Peptide deformylase-like n=1 Tax=Phyllobacterium pellucidum TaxID=2740464 RepID=A0A849VT63_9HYPH|nr:peptide deformylase [Phyllobacterium pellucidum]NTS31849.1 peptide deformylase [Phyllobacterium pellucidum]
MAIRPILTFPDPALRRPADRIADFGEATQELAQDLLAIMRAAPGIGITAPHVGVPLRLVVIEIESGRPRFYINPEIEWSSGDLARREEASVSMPGISDEIERPATIRARYQDLAGNMLSEEASGLLATCLQHEIDQLDGMFWIFRLSRLKRERLVKRFEKLQRLG